MSILKRKVKLEEFDSFVQCSQVKIEDYCPEQQIKQETPFTGTEASSEPSEDYQIKKEAYLEEYQVYKKPKKGTYNPMKGTKIVRNYAKALCSFATSNMAISYLQQIISRDYTGGIEIQNFRKYIKARKGEIASIFSLRSMLMETVYDTEEVKAFKRIFTEISVIFIKFFSVNWIFSGKVKYRLEHIKYRHKMLRRIKNPELFTYLKC